MKTEKQITMKNHKTIDHSINHKGHEGHNHGNTYFINAKVTWIINILCLVLATFYLVIKLMHPTGELRYVLHPGIWIPIAGTIIFTTGLKYFKTYKTTFQKVISVNLLMAIAAHSMFIYSVIISIIKLPISTDFASYHTMWATIVFIITLMDIGHSIEGKLNKSSQSGFAKLEALKQRMAFIMNGNELKEININEIKKDQIIYVKPNNIVPLDGILLSPNGHFNTSNITGEFLNSSLVKGKYVVSGSTNVGELVKIKVTKIAEESTITRIVKRIEDSTMKLTTNQKNMNKIVNRIIPFVILLSIATMVGWFVIVMFTDLTLFSWLNYDNKWNLPFRATFTVLDIAAPCALGMAIPLLVSVTAYIGGTNSIVFNSTKKIDEISNVKIIAFDKTGTITEEKFEIVNITGNRKYLNIVKALESDNNHPLAKSIFEAIDVKAIEILDKKNIPGIGVKGTYRNVKYEIRKSNNLPDNGHKISTYVSLYEGRKQLLTFELQPFIKLNAIKTISNLKKMNIKTVMITGDNEEAAKYVADKVGIEQYYSNQSPEDKYNIVKELKEEGKLMYIGDGFNDLAAAKEADVSVSFSTGDDILNDLTNVSLITNDLNALMKLFQLSKMNKKATNLSLSSVFILSFALIPLAILQIIPPFGGALIMIFVDILVVWNAWLYKKIGTNKLKSIN